MATMKFMNTAMTLLFVLAAALQYNDDHPMIWIAVYGASAVLCVLFAIGKFPAIGGSVFAAGCLIGSLVLVWKFFMADPMLRDELLKEAVGLFVVFLWISSLTWAKQREGSALT